MNFEKICVVGLGYIGLPTASMFASRGLHVAGVDINEAIVASLSRGQATIEEDGIDVLVREAVASGRLVVRSAPEPADAFVIAVPTPVKPNKTADMNAVIAATESIGPHLRPGNLVMLESTSPPGTTVHLVQPILERTGLRAGADFLLAYSPERVLPGRILHELVNNARVVGGIDRASAEAGRDLYAAFAKGEITLTDATTAEMVKLMENTFRDVNIALANEFALIAERLEVDVWGAIAIANRHPRVRILNPGPGVGGHCIAVDPWFLVEAAPEQARLIRQAREVNDGMPHHVVERVKAAVAGRAPEAVVVACLGLTYKADVDDVRESPAIEVVHLLRAEGFNTRVHDPHVTASIVAGHVSSLEAALDGADVVLVLTDHKEFRQLSRRALLGTTHWRAVIDTRHCLAD